MNQIDFKNICRLCLSEARLQPIFKPTCDEETNDFLLKINLCTQITVKLDDKLPDKICAECIKSLNDAILFRERCNKNDALLNEILTSRSETKPSNDDSGHSPYYCKSCSKTFVNKYTYNRHLSFKHSNFDSVAVYKCYACDKSFQSKWNRSVHEQNCKNISEKTVYECSICSATCTNRKSYDLHVKHHSRPEGYTLIDRNECTHCKKGFKSKQSLKQHLKLHDDKKYVCEHCGRLFKRDDYLRIHMTLHSDLKRLKCPECDFRCKQRSSLLVHMRTHSNVHRFKCKLCEYSCNSSSNLIRHKRQHESVTSTNCELCSKSFVHIKSLKEHIAIVHEGLNGGYSCNTCDVEFNRKRSLIRHSKKHRKNDQIGV